MRPDQLLFGLSDQSKRSEGSKRLEVTKFAWNGFVAAQKILLLHGGALHMEGIGVGVPVMICPDCDHFVLHMPHGGAHCSNAACLWHGRVWEAGAWRFP